MRLGFPPCLHFCSNLSFQFLFLVLSWLNSVVQQFSSSSAAIDCKHLHVLSSDVWKSILSVILKKKKSRQNTLLVPPLRPKLPQQLVSPELPHCICLEMKPEGMHGDSFNEQLKLNRMFWLMKRTVYKVTSSSILCVTDNPQMIPKFEKTAIFSSKWIATFSQGL